MNIPLNAPLMKLLYAVPVGIGLIALCSCGNEDTPLPPSPAPQSPYPLGEEVIVVPSEGGTLSVEPLNDEDADFAALGYIASYPFLDAVPHARLDLKNGKIGNVSVADYYGVYSVLEHNASIGIDGYVNSDEIEYEYEWIKVKCHKPDNATHTIIEIAATPNQGETDRGMFLYFTEPSLGLVSLYQQPAQ